MPNRIHETPVFIRRLKRLLKNHPHLKDDIEELKSLLIESPRTGASLGSGLYKVRVASTDKAKGKSGSFRTINYVIKEKTDQSYDIYFIVIYDKSEESNIDIKTLKDMVQRIWG